MAGRNVRLHTTSGSLVEVPTDEILRALIETGALPLSPEPAIRQTKLDPFWEDPASPSRLDDLVEELGANVGIGPEVMSRVLDRLSSELRTLLTVWPAFDRQCVATACAPRTRRPHAKARFAWERRARIFAVAGRPHLAQRFLALTRLHARKASTVPEMAASMGVSARSLTRHSMSWFDLSPGLLIDLARISSVALELELTNEILKAIATGHSFETSSTMTRLFRRFVGTSPSFYRSLFR